MTEIHAGYRVPAGELDEIPMDNQNNLRIQGSRPTGDYQRRLDAENYWNFVIQHRLVVVVSALCIAVVIAFVGIVTYQLIGSEKNYTVEINKITEVSYPATEESKSNDSESFTDTGPPVFNLQDDLSNDMIDSWIKEAYKILPPVSDLTGRTKRMKREIELASVESCKERHENCKVLLEKVKKMTKEVSQQVYQLQEMINQLGIINGKLPALKSDNVTALDFASCLQCEKIENETANTNVTKIEQYSDLTSKNVPSEKNSWLNKIEETIKNKTAKAYDEVGTVTQPSRIRYSESKVNPNVTESPRVSKNLTIPWTPVLRNQTTLLIKNGTGISIDSSNSTSSYESEAKNKTNDAGKTKKYGKGDFFFHRGKVEENSGSYCKPEKPRNKPEVTQLEPSGPKIPETTTGATEDNSAISTTSDPRDYADMMLRSTLRDQSYFPESRANAEPNPFVIPTAETTKGSQQMSYTPGINWMPYPLCVYGPASPQLQSPLMHPAPFGAMQYQPTSVPVLPQRYGPTGPGTQYIPVNPAYHQAAPTGQGRAIYCTYLPAPTFQFPTVPGISEFQRAADGGSDRKSAGEEGFEEQRFNTGDYESQCPPNARSCGNGGRCVPQSRWCDGEVDCDDASDETRCSCRDRVDKNRICDGYFDCPLGEDELGCSGCDEKSFSCDNSENNQRWGNCVPIIQRCDGYPDCANGKDEADCNIVTRSVEEREMFTVGYTNGYLHRNWRGKWYPSCSVSKSWASDACRAETGEDNFSELPLVEAVPLQQNYLGPFVVQLSTGEIQTVQSCSGNAVFVDCPKMICGTRISNDDDETPEFVPLYSESLPPRGFNDFLSKIFPKYESNETRSEDGTNGNSTFVGSELASANGTNENSTVLGESRVVGGRPSQPSAWPSLVAINRDGNFHCGGVIIDEIWVLTAAHCIDSYERHYFDIQSGILRRFSYSPMEQSRKVTHVVMYPSYDRAVMKNDIALLRLEAPLNFNRWVRPACLPEFTTAGEHWRRGPVAATTCVSAGWGSTVEHGPDPDHLREVELPILPNCKYLVDQNDAEICAGMPQGGRDTCQGDSGGPLMCRNPNSPSQWYVAGIVSHGEGCARPNEPGAYTKVSRFIDWINQVRQQGELPRVRPLRRCPGYYCRSGSERCYPSKRRCDKRVDCMDAEDELHCQKTFGFDFFRNSHRDDESNMLALKPEGQQTTDQPVVSTSETVITQTTTPAASTESSSTARSSTTSTEATIEPEERNTTERSVDTTVTVLTSTTTVAAEETTRRSDLAVPDVNVTIVEEDRENGTTPSQPVTNFSCKTLLQTIELKKRCDKKVDCEDGTDEDGCSCKDYLEKISPDSICDGHIDCRDASDEADCAICEPDEFHCKRSRECVPMDNRCDIVGDCEYNEDELGCLTLTNGKYVITDIDGLPHHNREGILTIYEDGEWLPFCIEDRQNRPATLGKQMCSYFGFAGCESFNETRMNVQPLEVRDSTPTHVIPYENATLSAFEAEEEPRCTAVYIRCLPTIHTVPLAYRLKAIAGHDHDTFLWPWHAAVFVDGRYKCSAVLLEPSWLLTSARCTDNLDLSQNYTAALLGVSRSYLQVDGPHQQMSTVDEIKSLRNSDAVLLHLKYPANMTRHVQPMYLQKRTQSQAESDTCATVGVDQEERTRTVFLRAVLHNCPDDRRCYKSDDSKSCENATMIPWSGTVVCFGCSGWYPAAVYHEETGPCSFSTKRSLSSIDYINTNLITGMQETSSPPIPEPKCNGFRCPLGQCIESKKVCDGVPHCRDGSDENVDHCREIKELCANGVHEVVGCHCAQSELRCADGQCVPKSSFCDGQNDCADGSDEPQNCTCAAYLKLTAPERICDGRRHCFDKSDEDPDKCLCKDASFRCDKGGDVCVSQDFVCDGQSDCPSGEDEKHCHTLRSLSPDMPGYGEVLERSSGVWHSRCYAAGSLAENKLEEDLCVTYGYGGASNVTEIDIGTARYPPVVPKLDKFHIVRLNPRTWIVARDDKALVTLHPPSEKCYRHYVTCA